MTYAELPPPRQNMQLKGGGILITRQPVLLCPACYTTFSANPHDYLDSYRDKPIVHDACDTPMVLAESRKTYIPYGMDAEYDAFMGELWAKANS